jgi:2'-5' RNA ligase
VSNPRLFVAVWPPAEVVELIAALSRPTVIGLRWTRQDQWHVTLRFLGAVADPPAVVEALASVAAAQSPVELSVGPAVGRFGHRVLHVPVEGLADLASAVTAATAHVGKPPEDRPFSGHLTLARVGKEARVNLRAIEGETISARWPVSELTLVESKLSPAGARYQIVERFPLTSEG